MLTMLKLYSSRTDFHSRISDATDSLVELGTKLSHSKHLEEVEQDAMQHKVYVMCHYKDMLQTTCVTCLTSRGFHNLQTKG